MEIDLEKLKASCRDHEGHGKVENGAFLSYFDTRGNLTEGYGHLVANGLSPAACEQILADDLDAALREISAYPWWGTVSASSEPRARTLAELYFELGHFRFNGFVHALGFLAAGDYARAADEFFNSQWAEEVGNGPGQRATVMCAVIRLGYSGNPPAATT